MGYSTWEGNRLAHFGIKGQRWGLRRYQNEDGSLTPEGMDRYGVGDGYESGNRAANAMTYPGQTRPRTSGTTLVNPRQPAQKKQPETAASKTFDLGKKLAVAGAAAAVLIGVYAGYKINRHVKNKAYAGILTKFIGKNADVSIHTVSGRYQLEKGLRQARLNSKTFKGAMKTNRYLRRNGGVKISAKEANRIRKFGKSLNRIVNVPEGKHKVTRKAFDAARRGMLNRSYQRIFM